MCTSIICLLMTQMELNDQTKMDFESTLLRGPSSNWMYMKVMIQATPQSWEEFKAVLIS